MSKQVVSRREAMKCGGRTAAGVAATTMITLPAVADAYPDAELIALGREYDQAWAEEAELAARGLEDLGRFERVSERIVDLENRITEVPAYSLHGLEVKARMASRLANLNPAEPYSDTRAWLSLVTDIERLATGGAS